MQTGEFVFEKIWGDKYIRPNREPIKVDRPNTQNDAPPYYGHGAVYKENDNY